MCIITSTYLGGHDFWPNFWGLWEVRRPHRNSHFPLGQWLVSMHAQNIVLQHEWASHVSRLAEEWCWTWCWKSTWKNNLWRKGRFISMYICIHIYIYNYIYIEYQLRWNIWMSLWHIYYNIFKYWLVASTLPLKHVPWDWLNCRSWT